MPSQEQMGSYTVDIPDTYIFVVVQLLRHV